MTPESTSSPVTPRTARRWPWFSLGIGGIVLVGAAVFWAATRPAPDDTGGSTPNSLQLPEVPAGPPWFRDRTADSGIDFTYRNGEEANEFTILESLGGGVAMLDYDGDGLLDLFFPGGGRFENQQIRGWPCRLYRNLGHWKFQDVTAEAGLDRIGFYTHGCAVADYDCDGWPDLLVTGYGRVALFHNEAHAGGRRFQETTARAGLNDTSWSTSAGWADLTGTGFPDLFICHYVDWSFANNPVCKGKGSGVQRDVCPPQQFKPLRDALFRNNRDGTFRDVTSEQKVRADGCGLGVVLTDFNGDGRPDIYVANDATNNHLYLNRGEGKLEEKGELAGVAMDENGLFNGSMGVAVGDYDRSGRASIFVTNYQGELHALYQNLGRGQFAYQSRPAGLATLGRHYVGFGTAFVDVDQDGWEDVLIANGHVLRFPGGSTLKQHPLLLRNVEVRGRRVFQDYSRRGGAFFNIPTVGRGIAVGDLDNDGWPDVVVSHTNSPVVLLRNEAARGNPARWLGIQLVGRKHRDLAGTTVVLEGGGQRLTRFVRGGGSYLSSSDKRLFFGLGREGTSQQLTVKWSWGQEQHWDNLAPNSYWELHEGESEPRQSKK